jgi:hypothetical protein
MMNGKGCGEMLHDLLETLSWNVPEGTETPANCSRVWTDIRAKHYPGTN